MTTLGSSYPSTALLYQRQQTLHKKRKQQQQQQQQQQRNKQEMRTICNLRARFSKDKLVLSLSQNFPDKKQQPQKQQNKWGACWNPLSSIFQRPIGLITDSPAFPGSLFPWLRFCYQTKCPVGTTPGTCLESLWPPFWLHCAGLRWTLIRAKYRCAPRYRVRVQNCPETWGKMSWNGKTTALWRTLQITKTRMPTHKDMWHECKRYGTSVLMETILGIGKTSNFPTEIPHLQVL